MPSSGTKVNSQLNTQSIESAAQKQVDKNLPEEKSTFAGELRLAGVCLTLTP